MARRKKQRDDIDAEAEFDPATADIDPVYGELLAPEGVVPELLAEIHWSGVLPGAIPALVDPPVVAAEAATDLEPFEPVIGLRVGEHGHQAFTVHFRERFQTGQLMYGLDDVDAVGGSSRR